MPLPCGNPNDETHPFHSSNVSRFNHSFENPQGFGIQEDSGTRFIEGVANRARCTEIEKEETNLFYSGLGQKT